MDSVLTDMARVGFKPAAESKKGGKTMKKKLISVFLCAAMAVTLVAGCGAPAAETGGNEEGSSSETVSEGIPKDEIKVGFVHVSDPSDMGYTYNQDLELRRCRRHLG